ncbi:Aspartyl/asparaginy/proline hydroxylase [uncultured Caudovirales phage]|uniref:Aspartyl/asparaginy/proline hydroxylase n=1 Tax=uncultured Caudovirales phage TaxID=2100421 RepID=A0A6J5TAF4_9CAUD|nr:Aspartyl/asparaginy/proline hydroxylase [uncultured Caudovirales phage]
MDQRFRRYYHTVDLARLQVEAEKLLLDTATGQFRTQMSLQTNGQANWDSGTGSRPGEAEDQWDKLHPDLVGTWWEDFFAKLPFKVYRSRLMTMQPRTCYSIHVDDNPRLHIAIKTTKQARFIFTEPPALQFIPADSHIWWVDTTKEHSAMNGSMEPRIHLVMCLVNDTKD